MTDPSKIEKEFSSPWGGSWNEAVYFIGIGGIGMSAVARFFHSKGAMVSGYDRTPTQLTKELEDSGIAVHYEENLDLIPKKVSLVVYTPAIPKSHKELSYYQQHGYKVVKRSDVLQLITGSSFNICIAGTHGKTTITTMVAHILRHSGFGCNAFLGGISVNYGTNFWSNPKNVCVVEADEYDRSFLKLAPDIAIISSMDPDHLDIYGTPRSVEEAFIEFSKKVRPGGILLRKLSLRRGRDLDADTHLTYSLDDDRADLYASKISMTDGSYEFDVIVRNTTLKNVKLHMGGLHNVENAVAAIGVASSLGIDRGKIASAVEAFRGVKRRFEYIVKTEDLVFIDDYAHHPEELRALITSSKKLFSDRKCAVIFQPHLYTRTRDLADGFGEVLDLADEVVLLPIYPARELPIEGVSSQLILSKMKKGRATLKTKEELLKWVKEQYAETGKAVLITAGAGDIDTLVEPIKQILMNR